VAEVARAVGGVPVACLEVAEQPARRPVITMSTSIRGILTAQPLCLDVLVLSASAWRTHVSICRTAFAACMKRLVP
jgi:hypothetical protein